MQKIIKQESILLKPKEQDIGISQILEAIMNSEEVLEKAFKKAEGFKVAHKQAC